MKPLKDILLESVFDVDDTDSLDPESFGLNSHPKSFLELKRTIIDYIKAFKIKPGSTVNLNWIDVSRVRSMGGIFLGELLGVDLNDYNYNVSNWDVSNVVTMRSMFSGCKHFDCDLSRWNTKSLEDATYMFFGCKNFKGDGVGKWNVKKLEVAHHMFDGCENLSCDLNKWKPVNLTKESCSGIFYGCGNPYHHPFPLPSWYDELPEK